MNGSADATPTRGQRTILASTVRNGPLSPDQELSNLMNDVLLQPQPSFGMYIHTLFLSPPVQVARWAHMHRFPSVLCTLSVLDQK